MKFTLAQNDTDKLWKCKTDHGWISVLERSTGYSFRPRDTETAFMDHDGSFWLLQGEDIRNYPGLSMDEAVEFIKTHAQYHMSGVEMADN